jgi:phosphatidylserine/phosphatidylglycerophosphate/cardiolipin synthase-like enzyme
MRSDLKLLFAEALGSAKSALFASFYSLTDRDLISLFSRQAEKGIAVRIDYDPTASLSLPSLMHAKTFLQARRSKGLMHRKILAIDQTAVYLGSANLTPPSLHHHSNFVLGLYHPELASFLSENDSGMLRTAVGSQELECYLLPETKALALSRLLTLIKDAKSSIHIAMFTLTHPEITAVLSQAALRGVHVHAVIDHYSANGASKKSVEALRTAKARVYLSRGAELLHHKWALIDEETFAMGSANWTKAAFTRNEDFLLILSSLSQTQKKFILDLYRILELESVE